ncbi:MAG: branched-chain amino acid ABC transporter permease [Anaerolineales bacterium]|jgi:branched-chain amino acid transport system permease protein
MKTLKIKQANGNRSFLWQLGTIVALAVVLILIKELGLLSNSILLIMQFVGIYSILALGINIVNGYLGIFSLAHAGFMAIGAYISAYLTKNVFMSEWLFIVAILIGGFVAVLIGILVSIPSFKTKGDYLAIITLGFTLIIQSILQIAKFVGAAQGLNNIPKFTNIYWVYGCLVVAVIIVNKFINSKYGRSLKAIREDQTASMLVSVDVRRMKTIAFALSAFIISMSGALIGHLLGYTSPSAYGFTNIVDGLVMVYLGGMGSIVGSIFGSTAWQLIVQLLKELGTWRWVVGGGILITVMIFLPNGVFGYMELKDVIQKGKDLLNGRKNGGNHHG